MTLATGIAGIVGAEADYAAVAAVVGRHVGVAVPPAPATAKIYRHPAAARGARAWLAHHIGRATVRQL